MSSFQQKACVKCGLYPAAGNQLRRCGSCLAVKYCSSACQTEDWTSHRLVCKNVGAARKEELVPLILATKNGDMATVEKLLEAGAKVNGGALFDIQGTPMLITPLLAAAEAGHAAVVACSSFEGGCQDEQSNYWRLHASIFCRAAGAQGGCIGAH